MIFLLLNYRKIRGKLAFLCFLGKNDLNFINKFVLGRFFVPFCCEKLKMKLEIANN
jgi:hypothetical protein